MLIRRTPPERTGARLSPRDEHGRLQAIDALERFKAKCEFDATTGCVVWTGGTTRGRGNTATYGSFWYEGRRWFAHRWAAVHIHGLNVGGLQVAHCCPHTGGKPNSLCVQHVQAQSQLDNLAELHARRRCVEQSNEERRYWLFVELGIEPPPPVFDPDELPGLVPFYEPPEWFRGPHYERDPDLSDVPF